MRERSENLPEVSSISRGRRAVFLPYPSLPGKDSRVLGDDRDPVSGLESVRVGKGRHVLGKEKRTSKR